MQGLILLSLAMLRYTQSRSLTSDLDALLRRYIEAFNAADEEIYVEDIPNSQAYTFLRNKIPLFTCPDKTIEEVYYFRWWTYRKHVKTLNLPPGRKVVVVTEFMPRVPWAGLGNTICAAAGHHIMEGRWIRGNDTILDDYSRFWLTEKGKVDPRRYSFWVASVLWSRFLVNGNFTFLRELLPKLELNYRLW